MTSNKRPHASSYEGHNAVSCIANCLTSDTIKGVTELQFLKNHAHVCL